MLKQRRFLTRLQEVLFLLMAGLGLAGVGGAEPPRFSSPTFEDLAERPKQAPAYPKLDSGLNRALAVEKVLAEAEDLGYRVRDGRIQVYVVTDGSGVEPVKVWLQEHDAAFISHAYDIVQAHVPPEALPALEELPQVLAVRKPDYHRSRPPAPTQDVPKVQQGDYVTEGLEAMNAQEWHALGYSGQGIAVGVIDGGFAGYESLLGSELPASVGFWSCPSCQPGNDKHGAACAEIVADLAPSAALYLAQVNTTVDDVEAAQWLRSRGVDVISYSLGQADGPGDGTGDLHDEIAAFTSSGGIWVVSAGNWRRGHWQGHWEDADGDDLLDFGGGDVTCISEDGFNPTWVDSGKRVYVDLVWNQWSSPQTNLDLILLEDLGAGFDEYLRSDDVQDGQPGQRPYERIRYHSRWGGWYCFAVVGVSGPSDVDVELFVNDLPIAPRVEGGSLLIPADAPAAFAVAALDAVAPYDLEPYSSAGPTNGPGGSLDGGRTKPDISAYANVSTSSKGPRSSGSSFSGTSAACPHVAGAAALVLSAFPGYTGNQVRHILEFNAIEMGPAGKDNDYGHGRLWLGTPPPGPPNADFTWSPTTPLVDQVIQFTDASTRFPTSWLWEFGDGSTSTDQNPTHSYAWSGSYTVTLTVTNDEDTDSESKTVNVGVGPPLADFTWAPVSPAPGESVQFTDMSAGLPNAWLWDFGDGATSAFRNPTHEFPSPGNYTVTLVVTNVHGTGTESKAVTVEGSTSPPVADFTWVPLSPEAGEPVQFADLSSGSPTSWSWSFGDGVTSTQSDPSHAFASEGAYTVALTVMNASGSDTVSKTVTVAGGMTTPVANFTWVPEIPSAGQTVQFTDASQGSPSSWEWAFGDGESSTERHPTHVYASAATYVVTLTAANAAGSDSESKTVAVTTGAGAPEAEFTWQPVTPVVGKSVTFADLSRGSPRTWHWDFGDGTTASSQAPEHVFAAAGSYTVTLLASNADGSDEVGKNVVVREAGAESVFIPVSAHAPGANDTFFVTDVRVFNPGAVPVPVTVFYTPQGSISRRQAHRTIPPGQVVAFPDVVYETFGVGSGSGTIEVRPGDRPVLAASRTYNTASTGTYGQFIDGRPASDAVGLGGTVHLLQLAKSTEYRSNVGFCETSGNAVLVRVRMFDQLGDLLGEGTQNLDAYSLEQINDVFSFLGVSGRDNVRVTLQVAAGSGRILGYGSVVDNLSSDQIYVPAVMAPASPEPLYVAAGASVEGANSSLWRTDLRVGNVAGTSRTVRLTYLPANEDNTTASSETYLLGPGELLSLNDVIQSVFGESGTGGLAIDTVPSGQVGLIATSRTYNESATGTFGQFIPAVPASEALRSGAGYLTALQVDRSESFRANVGFFNASAEAGSVEVELVSHAGSSLGARTYTLRPYSGTQINGVFSAFGVAWQDNARASFVVNGEGAVLGYASVIDNTSNDPVCVMGKLVSTVQPDLSPSVPPGWPGSVVISNDTGTHSDDAPVGGQPVYIDVAVRNEGNEAAGPFHVQLSVDGAEETWSVPGLAAGADWTRTDIPVTVAAGPHTLQLVADSTGSVAESDESNNIEVRTVIWGAGSLPDLVPSSTALYDSPIVVSNTPRSTTTSPVLTAGSTYFSWFVGNDGEAETSDGFRTALYIDGIRSFLCSLDPGLGPGETGGCIDGQLQVSAGTHTISTVVDMDDDISESDETNNRWEVELTWE